MILPRRLTFQLTPLLDLLLIVIFAQFMEVRSTTRIQATELAAAVERADQTTRDRPRVDELAARVDELEAEKGTLARELARTERRMDRLSQRFAEVFRVNEETLRKLLDADDPQLEGLTDEQVAKLREQLGELVRSRGAEAVEHLVTYDELRKRADVWRIRVGTVRERGRTSVTAGDAENSFVVESSDDFADQVFALYKSLPQPKDHVVILLTYDSQQAELVTLNYVRTALPQLVNRMQADGDSRFFWAEIGYDPRVLGLPD